MARSYIAGTGEMSIFFCLTRTPRAPQGVGEERERVEIASTHLGTIGPDFRAPWRIEEGCLRLTCADGRSFALFGNTDWNHLTIHVETQFDRSADIAVALRQSSPQEDLFATFERAARPRISPSIAASPGPLRRARMQAGCRCTWIRGRAGVDRRRVRQPPTRDDAGYS